MFEFKLCAQTPFEWFNSFVESPNAWDCHTEHLIAEGKLEYQNMSTLGNAL